MLPEESKSFSENVGILGLTHVGNRRVVQISTAFMIFFSIFGKFGAFFASIPLPIFAAIYCVLYGIVAAIGISFIQFTNNNSMRNIYILGLSLFLRISIPQYFVMNTDMAGHGPVKTDAGWCTSATDFLATYYFSHITAGEILTTPASLNLARHVVDCPSIFPEMRRFGFTKLINGQVKSSSWKIQ